MHIDDNGFRYDIRRNHVENTQRALDVGIMLKFSLDQRNDIISITFRHCSNVLCPLGIMLRPSINVTAMGKYSRQASALLCTLYESCK